MNAAEKSITRVALVVLCIFVAWGPLAQGSTFSGGRAGLIVLGALTATLWALSAALGGRLWRDLSSPWVIVSILLVGWIVVSVGHSEYSFASEQHGALSAAIILAGLGAHGLLTSPRRRRFMGRWMLIVALTMAVYAVMQRFGLGFTIRADEQAISAFYYHPSHYAGFVTLALPVCVWAALTSGAVSVRVAAVIATVILTVSLAFTNSSSLPTALLAGALALSVVTWRSRRVVGTSLLALVLIGTLTGSWLVTTAPGRTTLDSLLQHVQTKSVNRFLEERRVLWTMDAQAARDVPLWGVGPGMFIHHITQYRPDRATPENELAFNFVNYAHNDYYQRLIELGWPGLTLSLLGMIALLLSAPRQDALGAAMLCGLAAVWVSGWWDGHATVIPGTMAWVWVASGLVARLAPASEPAVQHQVSVPDASTVQT